jgi:hypothetical protein
MLSMGRASLFSFVFQCSGPHLFPASFAQLREDKIAATPEQADKRAEPQEGQVEHGHDPYRNDGGRNLQPIDSVVGQHFGE